MYISTAENYTFDVVNELTYRDFAITTKYVVRLKIKRIITNLTIGN